MQSAGTPPQVVTIVACPKCDCPSVFVEGKQVPGAPQSRAIENLPKEVAQVYEEARKCMSVGAHTAVALLCRKLLMNLAVCEGAKKKKSFAYYVDFLADKGYISVKARQWVDHIRQIGNEGTHELPSVSPGDAQTLLDLASTLLLSVHELPSKLAARTPVAPPSPPSPPAAATP